MTDPLEIEFKRRLRAAVHPRKKWVQSSEVAGNLCHAAKLLPKIVDPERRFGLLCDFIFEGNEVLKRVDDSNASLQSVFWDGDVASKLWDETAPLVADKGAIVRFVLLLHDKGWSQLALHAVLEWNRLYLPEDRLIELRDALMDRARGTKNKYDRDSAKQAAIRVWAQCGDLSRFDEFVTKSIRRPLAEFWQERVSILEHNSRWDEAIALCRECAPEHVVSYYVLEIARKSGCPSLMLDAYADNLRRRINAKTFRQAQKELPGTSFADLVRRVLDDHPETTFLDPEYATVLLDLGLREQLLAHVLGHAGDDICKMRFITGYFPLGTALAKAGEPLLATVPIRLGVDYLMSQCNSRYYLTVHRKMSELAVLATRVSDWGPIPDHATFERGFAESYANRRAYWN